MNFTGVLWGLNANAYKNTKNNAWKIVGIERINCKLHEQGGVEKAELSVLFIVLAQCLPDFYIKVYVCIEWKTINVVITEILYSLLT